MFKDNFIKNANKIHNNKYDYSLVEYKNSLTKVKIICPEHGIFEQTPGNHTGRKSGCPKCGVLKRSNSQKKTTSKFIMEAKKIHGDKYDYSQVNYINAHSKVEIICPDHGSFFQEPGPHLFQKSGCLKCHHNETAERLKLSLNEFIEYANDIHNYQYDYSKVNYVSMHDKIEIICNVHGSFWQLPKNHIHKQNGCPKCKADNARLDIEDFINKARQIHGDLYNYDLVNYNTTYEKVKIICPKHGIFEQRPNSHISQGNACPKCCNHISKPQKEIYNWIVNNFSQYSVVLEDSKNYSNLRLDITIPELNLAIELNGVYWHSINSGRPLNHLNEKRLDAQAQGLRIINIYEDEWINSRLQMEQIIKNALGVIENKVAARKCKIWSCDTNSQYFNSHIKPFFNLYHHQGLKHTPLGIAYCLLYEDQIVACAYFGQNRYHANNECELIRYATKADYKVQGGLSKLITAFRRNHPNFKQIVSYCDNRFFTGSSYLKVGFKLVKEIDYGFSIILPNMQRKHRSFITKKRLSKYIKDQNIMQNYTQQQIAIHLGWFIVPDCGQNKYIIK